MKTREEYLVGAGQSKTPEPNDTHPTMKLLLVLGLAIWFGVVGFFGARGTFLGSVNSPPLGLFFGFATPLALFFVTYFVSGSFRSFVLNADLRLVAAIQAWRWAGVGFLTLYTYGVLPGLFAFPAGLGDMAVGFAAPWIVYRLVRHKSFAASRQFVTWNLLGILDLVVAVSLGTICSGFFRGIPLNVTTSPMSRLPLVFIPVYLVPIFIMLHFTALAQSRRLARAANFAGCDEIEASTIA